MTAPLSAGAQGSTATTIQRPPLDTTRVGTEVRRAFPQTLLLGGLVSGPPILYLGLDVSVGTTNGEFSVTPGNQSIDLGSRTGWAARAGVAVPITSNFAIGAGGKYLHFKDDTVRLNNADGTFVNTGGSNEINAIVGELSAMLRILENITLRISGYYGGADRKINLISGGATALDFSDWVSASGVGFGVGVPASVFGINVPGLCFTGGWDYMYYGGADGFTTAGAPISLGGFDDTRVYFGGSFFLQPADFEIFTDGIESGNTVRWSCS